MPANSPKRGLPANRRANSPKRGLQALNNNSLSQIASHLVQRKRDSATLRQFIRANLAMAIPDAFHGFHTFSGHGGHASNHTRRALNEILHYPDRGLPAIRQALRTNGHRHGYSVKWPTQCPQSRPAGPAGLLWRNWPLEIEHHGSCTNFYNALGMRRRR